MKLIDELLKEKGSLLENPKPVMGRKRFVIECPIHHGEESTCVIDPNSSTFRCIECGVRGTFDFLMEKFSVLTTDEIK